MTNFAEILQFSAIFHNFLIKLSFQNIQYCDHIDDSGKFHKRVSNLPIFGKFPQSAIEYHTVRNNTTGVLTITTTLRTFNIPM